MLDKTLAIILAGGCETPLQPLTAERAKAAIPFGGKYRIIDFTLANCLESGIRKVLVMTQYKFHSLQKHLRDGWSIFNPELGEYITPVPPQMRSGETWYTGTADAVYQNRYLLERSSAELVILLSGDHVYRMDYAAMLAAHCESGADVTIACTPVPVDQARKLGVMELGVDDRVVAFDHKPEHPATLADDPGSCMVSMGIYVFSKKLMLEMLGEDHASTESGHDFGGDILPCLVQAQGAVAYRFGGEAGRVSADRYWRDVGTLDAFYQANMDLLKPSPPLDIYQADWPIRTYQIQGPPARTVPGKLGSEGIFINSIVAGGVVISGGTVKQSILFPGVYVGDEAIVENALLFNGVRIEDDARVRDCIIDKDVVVAPGARVGYDREQDRSRFTVTEAGIVVIPKGYRFR